MSDSLGFVRKTIFVICPWTENTAVSLLSTRDGHLKRCSHRGSWNLTWDEFSRVINLENTGTRSIIPNETAKGIEKGHLLPIVVRNVRNFRPGAGRALPSRLRALQGRAEAQWTQTPFQAYIQKVFEVYSRCIQGSLSCLGYFSPLSHDPPTWLSFIESAGLQSEARHNQALKALVQWIGPRCLMAMCCRSTTSAIKKEYPYPILLY